MRIPFISLLVATIVAAVSSLGFDRAEAADARFARPGAASGAFVRPQTIKPPKIPGRVITPPRLDSVDKGKCFGRRCPGANAGTVTVTCPAGTVRKPGRGCVPMVGVEPCKKGSHRVRGRCVPDKDDVVDVGPCKTGSHRVRGRCVPDKDHVVDVGPCKTGLHRVRGRCVPDKDDVVDVGPCKTGSHRVRGRCVPDKDDVVDVGPCKTGSHRVRGRCVPDKDDVVDVDPGKSCAANTVRRGKRCVFVGPPSPPRVANPAGDSTKPARDRGGARKAVASDSEVVFPPEIRRLVTDRPHRPREVVVLVQSDGADAVITDLMRQHALVAEERQPIALIQGTLVRFSFVDNRPMEQVLMALAGDARVMRSQPNFHFTASDAAQAGMKHLQYAPAKIRLPEAHVAGQGQGVLLAVLDTGVDATHAEIKGAIAKSFDALNEGPVTAEAHGTAITGIISARSKLAGVAPLASVLSVRAFASEGGGPPKSTSMAIAKGIDWAFANQARLFNLSFAGPDDPIVGLVISEATAKGAIFVAASGNGGPKAAPAYPAAYPNVIAVTATDDRDAVFAMAQGGDHVAVAAPGVDILAPSPGGGYDVSSGTSLAAAHVTGVIALMLEQEPALSNVDVRAILAKTAHGLTAEVSSASSAGAGLIDAAAASHATGALRVAHPTAQATAE